MPIKQFININLPFAENALHPGVCVLHVRSRVALHRQHFIPVKNIIAHQVVRQIRVLNRPDPHRLRYFILELFGQIWILLLDNLPGPLLSLIQQSLELDRLAAARLERPIVLTQHTTKRHMLQMHRIIHPLSLFRRSKNHLKMQLLPRIRHINHPLSLQLTHPITYRRQISRRIQKSTVTFLHNQWQRLTLLALKPLQKNTLRTIRLFQQSFFI